MVDGVDELKKLSPKERLRRLKELEEKKREELEETKQAELEAEEEISEEEELERKVPIEQVTAESEEQLETEEEKAVFRVHRGELAQEEEGGVLPQEEHVLEEVVSAEEIPREVEVQYGEMSHEPMQRLYGEIREIQDRVYETGVVSREDAQKAQYVAAAAEQKLDDIESGEYTPGSLVDEVKKEISLASKINDKIQSMYKSNVKKSDVWGVDYQ